MKHKKLFIQLFTLILFCYQGLSQSIPISGRVSNENNSPVTRASVIALSQTQKTIIAFTFTDNDGRFSLTIPSSLQDSSFKLQISHLGYRKIEISLPLLSQKNVEIKMQSDFKPLPEVTVRNKAIYQRGDTVNYSVKNFLQKQDLVIGDVIRRLPGIEVTPEGIIKYQGRAINKYYIEGLDLLEDKYNLANNNLPANAVNNVQVIENHQPIKALDSFAFSQQAALNITLNEGYKSRIIGRAKSGVGWQPLGIDAEAVPMKFSRGAQTIATYKFNNTGNDYSRELNQLNLNESINRLKGGFLSTPLTSIPFPGTPSLTPERVLFNRLHMVSFNHLKKLKKNYELKLLLDATTDRQQQTAGNTIRNFFSEDTITIREEQNITRRIDLLRGSAIVMSNTAKHFLKNSFTVQWNRTQSDAQLIGSGNFRQQVSLSALSIGNELQLLHTQHNKVKGFYSFISYHTQPEQLGINPGPYPQIFNTGTSYNALRQPLNLKTLYTNNYFTYDFRKRRVGFENKAGFSYLQEQFSSNVYLKQTNSETAAGPSYRNGINAQEISLYAQTGIRYAVKKWKVGIELPFSLLHLRSSSADTTLSLNRLLPNASMLIQNKLSSWWTVSLQGTYNTMYLSPYRTSANVFLNSYRVLQQQNVFFKTFTQQELTLNLQYKDVLKSFFANGGVGYSNQLQNFLANQQFSGSLVIQNLLPLQNPRPGFKAYTRLSKYFYRLKSSAAGGITLSTTTTRQMQNGVQSNFENKTLNVDASINTTLGAVNADYKVNWQEIQTGFAGKQQRNGVTLLNQFFTLNANLPEGYLLQWKAEQFSFRNAGQPRRAYYFSDVNLRKKISNKNIHLELSWLNIFNNAMFSTLQIFGNTETVAYFVLRPAQVIAKINFTF